MALVKIPLQTATILHAFHHHRTPLPIVSAVPPVINCRDEIP